MISPAQLHRCILKNIIDFGHAPNKEQLSVLLGCSEKEVVVALCSLQEYHGVVLHPNIQTTLPKCGLFIHSPWLQLILPSKWAIHYGTVTAHGAL